MIGRRRVLRESTIYAATLASLVALVACGSDDGTSDDGSPPPFQGELGMAPTPPPAEAPGGAAEPVDTSTEAPIAPTPSGEESPVDVPLTPPSAGEGSGAGNGSGAGEGDGAGQGSGAGEGEGDGAGEGSEAPEAPPQPEPQSPEPAPPELPGFVENAGEGCVVPALPNTGDLPTIAGLPDPFAKLDGSRVSTRAEWRCRREEIKQQAERYVYGAKPPRPENVSGSVSNDSITVNVTHQGRSTSFSVGVELPQGGTGPFPALVSVGTGFFEFSHNDLVRNEGVAIISYDPYAVGSEEASRENKTGAFYDIYGNQSTTGLLVAWAWGVSRIIDVIEQSGGGVLAAEAVGAAGCSRFGKGALAVGAFDERVALTIPFESGSAGVPILRGIGAEGAQSLSSAFTEQHWLGDVFGVFTNSPTRVPIDMHEVVAMVAPRGLLILDNPHIANLGPRSAHASALAGAEVFAALGVRDNISYHSAVQDGAHCSARTEHQEPVRQNVRKFLLKTGNAPGAITAAAATTANLAELRSWDTPTLN